MLDADLKAQLQAYMERITVPFEIVATLDDSEKSAELKTLLTEIAAMSEHITLREDGDNDRKPSFHITRPGGEQKLFFAGIPLGHEFTSLVLALLQVGGHPSRLGDDVIEEIGQ